MQTPKGVDDCWGIKFSFLFFFNKEYTKCPYNSIPASKQGLRGVGGEEVDLRPEGDILDSSQ